jgi:cation transport regulator ChaC
MWHKVARDGSGKCDIISVQDLDSLVYGVVYEIPAQEKSALDRAEGLGHGYGEQTKTVELAVQLINVQAYVATHTHPDIHPYTWYRALVVAGAVEHQLPPPYVDGLRRAPAVLDTDEQRHIRHMALAGDVGSFA